MQEAAEQNIKPTVSCGQCADTGTYTYDVRTGRYVAAGPTPSDAPDYVCSAVCFECNVRKGKMR